MNFVKLNLDRIVEIWTLNNQILVFVVQNDNTNIHEVVYLDELMACKLVILHCVPYLHVE